ncbi:MAG: hypothetical protein A3E78_15485 [Alphaproteobacteria bacterium RIFCSPHIGHO2_12_FULL_63_12]|nr:MAG: hypothetical protein A3E78_15485 [Alphaproteobacteria bacterium RIFCSPHIGHO2_12_FULL_63_12]
MDEPVAALPRCQAVDTTYDVRDLPVTTPCPSAVEIAKHGLCRRHYMRWYRSKGISTALKYPHSKLPTFDPTA